MKKLLGILLCLPLIYVMQTGCNAFSVFMHDLDGKVENVEIGVNVYDLVWKDDEQNSLENEHQEKKPIKIDEAILAEAEANDKIIILDLKADSEENAYPEIESMAIEVCTVMPSGKRQLLGKDYRVFYFRGESSENLSGNIFDSNKYSVQFTTDKLGRYVIYVNPSAYDIVFYYDEPQYDEDGNLLNPECIYSEFQDMSRYEVMTFPKIPEKEGYVFTGWIAWSGSGLSFVSPQPISAYEYDEYYATWCPEDEYEPINIEISANEPITKGKENGAKITLKTNYGAFERYDFPSEWREEYESAETEEDKAEILSYWKEFWNVVGTDEIIIEKAERIDDQTVELTLSGNSSNIYRNEDIEIEFAGYLLTDGYDEDGEEVILHENAKIKMDEDGVRAKMYRSDNSITLKKQSRPSSGSGGGTTRYAVNFETDSGSEVKTQYVKKSDFITEPETPVKDGYNFCGWFEDSDFIKEYDFSRKAEKSVTLYAKWEENNKIIFTLGEKEATVFGEKKQLDRDVIIKNDRAFLPARFVAESLGAEVSWDEENRQVTITKGETEIVIKVGESEAFVNGESEKLDYPAFIESGRTYTPMRFVAESLGAEVFWEEKTGEISIIKKDVKKFDFFTSFLRSGLFYILYFLYKSKKSIYIPYIL